MNNYGLGGTFIVGARARWHVRYSQHGRQIREATGILVGADPEASKAKAQKYSQRRLVEIESGKFTPKQDKLTLEQVLDDFLAAGRVKGLRSVDSTATVLKHVRAFFRGYRAIDVTSPKLRNYVNARTAKKAAPASIQRELSHLRAALRLAVDDKRLTSVPRFPTIKVDNARQGFIEPADFERLHAELPAELKDFATFLYWSGWRSNEAKTLEWRDVDTVQGEIRLRSQNSKTSQARTLPLFGAIKELIERRGAESGRPDSYVLCRANGRPLGQIIRTWKNAAARAGLGHLTSHDLRRSAIRNLVRSGVSQHVAMAWSGHRTASIFARYDITSGSDLANAADRLTAYVETESAKQIKVVPLARPSRKLATSTGTNG